MACKRLKVLQVVESSLGYWAWHPVSESVSVCICVRVCFDTLTLTMMYVLREPFPVRVCVRDVFGCGYALPLNID